MSSAGKKISGSPKSHHRIEGYGEDKQWSHLRHGSLGTHIWLFADIWKYLNSDIQPVPRIKLFSIVKICK